MTAETCTHGGADLGLAVRRLYDAGQTDYALEPIVLVDAQGKAIGRVADGDAVIFCCRRGEREVQLTEAFTEAGFDHFPRPTFHYLDFVILTLYHEKFRDLPVAFAPSRLTGTLSGVIGKNGLRQLHTSESEKFAHVTFFFNGGQHQPLAGEDDARIPSPRDVPFDQVPELSLPGVVEEVLRGVRERRDFIVVNFANGDVIGHTSNNEAKLRCASVVDHHLKHVVDAALAAGYVTFITADHGNLELMTNPDGSPHVAHTANPVPFIALDAAPASRLQPMDGSLADVAPTVLAALDLPPSSEMAGTGLLPGRRWGGRRRVLLIILDGWGIGTLDATNPIHLASTPFWDSLTVEAPYSKLEAAGEAVGLQAGKAGNSEAGHMNLGAGRLILQDDARLDLAMKNGTFQSNEILCRAVDGTRRRGGCLHLIGLLSEKSSHGSIEYPLALLRMARDRGLRNAFLHVIFDGRSTAPGSAPALLEHLDSRIHEIGIGRIVSGMGRGIALDRDGNYDKTRRAYEALVLGRGVAATSA